MVTEATDCHRHKTYLAADIVQRRLLKFHSTGPLVVEHQMELAQILEKLSNEYYTNKPSHLNNYEYDVLYPEVHLTIDLEF